MSALAVININQALTGQAGPNSSNNVPPQSLVVSSPATQQQTPPKASSSGTYSAAEIERLTGTPVATAAALIASSAGGYVRVQRAGAKIKVHIPTLSEKISKFVYRWVPTDAYPFLFALGSLATGTLGLYLYALVRVSIFYRSMRSFKLPNFSSRQDPIVQRFNDLMPAELLRKLDFSNFRVVRGLLSSGRSVPTNGLCFLDKDGKIVVQMLKSDEGRCAFPVLDLSTGELRIMYGKIGQYGQPGARTDQPRTNGDPGFCSLRSSNLFFVDGQISAKNFNDLLPVRSLRWFTNFVQRIVDNTLLPKYLEDSATKAKDNSQKGLVVDAGNSSSIS